MLSTLAYGEFRSFDLVDMFFSTLPFVLRLIVLALIAYAPASAIAQYAPLRWRWAGLAVFVFMCALITPTLGVMGAFGPAHVSLSCGVLAFPLLGTALLVKTIVFYLPGRHRTPPDQIGPRTPPAISATP